jgi:hypothetical protein
MKNNLFNSCTFLSFFVFSPIICFDVFQRVEQRVFFFCCEKKKAKILTDYKRVKNKNKQQTIKQGKKRQQILTIYKQVKIKLNKQQNKK